MFGPGLRRIGDRPVERNTAPSIAATLQPANVRTLPFLPIPFAARPFSSLMSVSGVGCPSVQSPVTDNLDDGTLGCERAPELQRRVGGMRSLVDIS